LRLICSLALLDSQAQDTGAKAARGAVQNSDPDHSRQRESWFYRGRVVRGLPAAELRRRAVQTMLRLRSYRANAANQANSQASFSLGSWTPLGPVPLASDASGNGTQDYGAVAGRATSVAIDPADPSGNTVYIGGAQGGIWKSTNAANPNASNVAWTPISDNQATLSIGAIAIQPGNSDPAKSVILAATGEANNSSDSYFGLGILRSADGGSSWNLIATANNGALSFGGLGGTRIAFSTAAGQTSTVVSAMAMSSEGLVDGAVTSSTAPGLYTSRDAGQNWTYNALSDPGGQIDASSATSFVYNAAAGQFFAAVRFSWILFLTRWRDLDQARESARRNRIEPGRLPAEFSVEQLFVPDSSGRDCCRAWTERDVRLVRLRSREWRGGRRRTLAKHERGSVMDSDIRQWHYELRRRSRMRGGAGNS